MGTLVTPRPTSMVWDSATNRFVPVGETAESPVQGLLDDVFLDRNVFDANVLNNTVDNIEAARKSSLINDVNYNYQRGEPIPFNGVSFLDGLSLDQDDPIASLFGGQYGIQTSQEMFDETYQDALAADALDSIEQEGQFSSGNATLDMLNQAIADKEAGVIKTKGTEQGVVEMTPEESDAAYDVTIKGLTDKLVSMGVPVSDLPVPDEEIETTDDDNDLFGNLIEMLTIQGFDPNAELATVTPQEPVTPQETVSPPVTPPNGNGDGDSNNNGNGAAPNGNGNGNGDDNNDGNGDGAANGDGADAGTQTVVTDGIDGIDGIDGTDGTDGLDGLDGIAGKDGKDGKDGLIMSMLASPIANNLFETEFGYDYLKPEYIDRLFRGKLNMNNNSRGA